MRSSHNLDRLAVVFDDARQVAGAGLLLPATLAAHLGLRALVERWLDLGSKPGRANVGDKVMTLVFSALAGGDCIDDASALRAGNTESVLGFRARAASTALPVSPTSRARSTSRSGSTASRRRSIPRC